MLYQNVSDRLITLVQDISFDDDDCHQMRVGTLVDTLLDSSGRVKPRRLSPRRAGTSSGARLRGIEDE